MRRPGAFRSVRPPQAEKQAGSGSRRDRLAVLVALVSVACVVAAFFFSKNTQFLMPGPLASAHGTIENCGACHTKSGSSNVSWIHGLIAGDPLADSKACLTCHKMPDTAFNAHSASAEALKQSTSRLTKIAATTPAPASARVQDIAFPADSVMERSLYCATCHQEHKGVNFNLSKISNEQCGSCHVVKFDSFDGHHPQFENYPFERRTRIIYDHAGHFGKHFLDVAKKDPTKRVPDTCATCHDSRADKRIMAVAPFDQTCATCHLDQILGKERVSGPKGIAFLSLPGLDLQTLKKKNAAIGEWPEDSEAELTAFMKVMISRNERGRALIKRVEGLNLQDLSGANDAQIKAVTSLAWEVKGLFYALISGKASDVLADLKIGGGPKLSASLLTDLTASIPREVVSGAQQWLPNLGTEMANRPQEGGGDQPQSGWNTIISESKLAGSISPEELSRLDAGLPSPDFSPRFKIPEAPSAAKPVQLAETKQQIQSKSAPGATVSTKARTEEPEEAVAKPDAAAPSPESGKEAVTAAEPPADRPSDQTDDLLNPTEEELRAIKAATKDGGKGAEPERAAGRAAASDPKPETGAAEGAAGQASGSGAPANAWAASDAPAAEAPAKAAPVVTGIQSDIDPESWAEYGGWYRQDYAIFYRPTGHKDKFIYSWLKLTGPHAPKGDKGPPAAVFNVLTGKDAQGSCTKCHSVDETQGKARVVNFSPPKIETKQGRFTNFIHEPHFGILENRGCLTCHTLEKGRPYLQSYEQGNPRTFVSNFGAVKKDLCQTCHTSSAAGQDCLTCHKYHVDGVITPVMSTKIPSQ
jgi:hypothetical protein